MATIPKPIAVTTDTDWPRLLDEAAAAPVRVERDGLVFRVSREEPGVAGDPDPELVRATLMQTIGSWADLDIDQIKRDLSDARRAGSRPADRP